MRCLSILSVIFVVSCLAAEENPGKKESPHLLNVEQDTGSEMTIRAITFLEMKPGRPQKVMEAFGTALARNEAACFGISECKITKPPEIDKFRASMKVLEGPTHKEILKKGKKHLQTTLVARFTKPLEE